MFGWIVLAMFALIFGWLVASPTNREARLAFVLIGSGLLVLLFILLARGEVFRG